MGTLLNQYQSVNQITRMNSINNLRTPQLATRGHTPLLRTSVAYGRTRECLSGSWARDHLTSSQAPNHSDTLPPILHWEMHREPHRKAIFSVKWTIQFGHIKLTMFTWMVVTITSGNITRGKRITLNNDRATNALLAVSSCPVKM